MADDPKPLEILIKTKADLVGINKATEATKNLTAAQEKLADQTIRTSEISQAADLAALRGLEQKKRLEPNKEIEKAIGGFIDSQAAADELNLSKPNAFGVLAEDAEKATVHTRGLGAAVTRLGSALGGIGGLGRVIFNPLALGAFAFGAALEYVDKKLQVVTDKAVALINVRFDTLTASNNDFIASLDDLDDALAKAAKSTDPIKDKYNNGLTVLNDTVEAHKKILAAMEAEESAAAGDDKVKQDEIKARYASARTTADTSAERQRLANEQSEAAERSHTQPGLKNAAQNAIAAVDAAKNDPALVKSQAAISLLTDSDKKDLQNARALVEAEGGAEAVRKMPVSDADTGELGANSESTRYVAAQEALKLIESYDDNQAVIAQQTETIRRLNKKQDEATNAAVENEKAYRELTEKIKADTTALGIHEDTAKIIKEIGAPQTPFGQQLIAERPDALKIIQGQAGQVSADSQKVITDIGVLIAGHSVTLQQAAQLILRADATNASFMRALDAITATGEAMRTHSQLTADKFYAMERDIAAANQKIKQAQATADQAKHAVDTR